MTVVTVGETGVMSAGQQTVAWLVLHSYHVRVLAEGRR